MTFLEQSEAEWQRINAEKKRERRKKLRQTQWAAGILGSLFLVTFFLAFYAWRQTRLAQKNLQLAKQAVDESLSSAGREQAREGSDLPQMEQFRKELLDKAAGFYTIFARQNTSNTALRAEEARAHSRLGDINRLIGNTREAVKEYTDAIARFEQLAHDYPKEERIQPGPGLLPQLAGRDHKAGTQRRSELTGHRSITSREGIHRSNSNTGAAVTLRIPPA